MCKFWSCILTRDGRVLWDKDIVNHSELIRKHGLADVKLIDRDFVKIEIRPDDIMSKKMSDWTYEVDEEGTLPDWYANDPLAQEKIVWKEWKLMLQQIHANIKAAGLNLDRMKRIEERCMTMKPGDAKVSRSTIKASLAEYVKRLQAQDKEKREWDIVEVRYHTVAEWYSIDASIRASIRASIYASIYASIRASIYASIYASIDASIRASIDASILYDDAENYGLPRIDMMDAGCLLMGIDMDGVAHVVIVGKDDEGGDL